MSWNLRKLLAAVSLASVSLLSGSAWASYTGLYVFGDSLADSGNNYLALGGQTTSVPITNPNDLIPTYPYANAGTYSNGPVWTQYLANSLGLALTPSLAGGTNYAFGGARTGPGVTPPSLTPFPPSMITQVNMAFGAAGAIAPSTALYVVEGGGNDARDVLLAALGGGLQAAAPLIGAYATNVASILATLSSKGADQFLVWNVPDIGKIPAIAGQGAQASNTASFLVALMNQALVQALSLLPADVTDGVHLFDAYGVFNDVVGNPGAYGFTDVSDPCAFFFYSQTCYGNPSGYLFWDGIHPTTQGYQLLARLALAEIPEPETLLLLAIGMIGIVVTRRKAA